jgi:uncharacterized protein YdiU (UPF0061 family)
MDNINITGESFDYGPWRFLPVLDPRFTAAYFDENGLYAYGAQPDALLWNLTRLAECLLPFAKQEALEKALDAFRPAFHDGFKTALLRRLGLVSNGDASDTELTRAIWKFMLESKIPFERFFFDWHGGMASRGRAEAGVAKAAYASAEFAPVRTLLESYAQAENANPGHAYFEQDAPCTMLVDDVEALWAPIAESDDWSKFHDKLKAIELMSEAYGALIDR